jgi:hypothetical protein
LLVDPYYNNIYVYLSLDKILETDRAEFCLMHYAETVIVPTGIKAGYPTNINFKNLSDRINKIKDDLLDIINCKIESWFRNLALDIYNELGSQKARTPMILMGRSEELRVRFKLQ